MARNVGRYLFWGKPVHQDGLWLFCASEEQEVLCLVNLVASFGETRFERGTIGTVAIHHDHIANADAPLLDRDRFGLLRRRLSTGLTIDHTAFLPRRVLCLAGYAVLETVVE